MKDDGHAVRDPNRIDEVLKKVAEVWKANPDLRLGQIVVSATSKAVAPRRQGIELSDVFYIEDDALLAHLKV